MVAITPREEVEHYYSDTEHLNQSKGKNLLKGFEYFMANQDKDISKKEFIIIGKAVDTILTAEPDDFHNEFYTTSSDTNLSDVQKEILNFVLDKAIQAAINIYNIEPIPANLGTLEENSNKIELALETIEWNKHWKMETRINKIIEAGRLQFEDMKKSIGKTILSQDQYSTVTAVVNSLKTNPRTKKYFNRHDIDPNVIIAYQYPIFGTLNGVKCKGLLDIVILILDESGLVKRVIPIDLKTTANYTIDFPSAVKSFRYDIQGAWYTDLLLSPGSTHPSWVPKFSEDVVVSNFTFIVESTVHTGTPLVFVLDDSAMYTGRHGYTDENSGTVYSLGYHHILEDYKYYCEQGWRMNRLVAENDVLYINHKGNIVV